MERETPPPSPTHEAGDVEVSSRRSPDLPKLEANASAALSPECLAPMGGDEKGPTQFDVWPDILTGLLERAALSEEHRSLMSTMIKKISSSTSGLNEALRACSEALRYVVKNTLFFGCEARARCAPYG